MEYVFALLCTFVALSSGESIQYHNCQGADMMHAKAVRLSPCPSEPCKFSRGSTVNVEIDFVAVSNSSDLSSQVWGLVAGIPVPYPLPNGDGCKDSGITCPISEDQVLTYKSSFKVLKEYPLIQLPVKWELNANSKTVNQVCFTFPMAIVDKEDNSIVG